MRRASSLACAAAAILAGGCGNQQVDPPDASVPARPVGTTPAFFDQQGLRFGVPGGWHVRSGAAPLVATVQSGTATVAVWRYPRSEPLPKTNAQLTQARDLLLQTAKARDQTFKEAKTAITKLDSHPAIQVRGTETISGQPRTVRSTHVYAFGAEIVVDAFAPAGVFDRVDSEVFRPLLRSLRLQSPSS
jgi:hypothetical protein